MDTDDQAPRPPALLVQLGREDLERLSVAELEARILALEAEIARAKATIQRAVNHRAMAETLFKS